MNLHENTEFFKQGVCTTADQKNISTIYVEKDYWVFHSNKSILDFIFLSVHRTKSSLIFRRRAV